MLKSLLKPFLPGLIALVGLMSCTRSHTPEITVPVKNQPSIDASLGEKGTEFNVLGNQAFRSKQTDLKIVSAESVRGRAFLKSLITSVNSLEGFDTEIAEQELVPLRGDSLTVGFPKGLLKEQQLFGGVITTVSDKESETLGRLKLSDLPPVHVRALVIERSGKFTFVLAGCEEKCEEGSTSTIIQSIPIIGVDDAKGLIYLDLASIGDKLNLAEILDPKGEYTQLKTQTSKTVTVDYSTSTLVFDVEAVMVPLEPKVTPVPETRFTTRWYLRLNSTFNPSFVSRTATEGVGYFMTERTTSPRVQRWAIPLAGSVGGDDTTVKYYIKYVPDEVKPAFQAAFDEWNERFETVIGRKLLSYEFISEKDERAKYLVPGDVRYKILEWDIANRAPYGGLGPSIANQFTGEMLTANVLIQGPHILKLYRAWFDAGKNSDVLKSLLKELDGSKGTRYTLSLGKRLAFKIHSQEPALEDPIMQRDDFEPLPAEVSFESYMQGYFRDMVAHELGHNLGLRHNFRGNLGAAPGVPQPNKVSSSIMEYLGRNFRYLDAIGAYDVMALEYGYKGVLPAVKNAFCTDEDVPAAGSLTGSAECSRDDATSDPFSFFENRLTRAIDLLTGRVLGIEPVWNVDDMDRELSMHVTGIGLYGLTSGTASNWTNFFGKEGRPQKKEEVRQYALDSVLKQTCDPKLLQSEKPKVLENVQALRKKVGGVLKELGYLESEGQCTID